MNLFKTKTSGLIPGLSALVLLLAGQAAISQTVNLTAAPTSTTLPDGVAVPMWGYQCGVRDANANGASCVAANPLAGSGWSPVVITVPYNSSGNTSLTINLTNNLVFGSNSVPTSLTIIGQVGGGLGGGGTTTASPVHSSIGVTWPTADPTTTPPPTPQLPRVQSFGTEVAPAGTTAAAGQVASGSALTWSNLRPGTYLIESGTHPSIQGPMGLYGVLVVTTAVSGATPGQAYPAVTGVPTTAASSYDADIPLVFGEIDPVQNAAVAAAVATAGFSETTVWSGLSGGCASPANVAANAVNCYPPAVNYSPRYYLINGVSFDRTNMAASTIPLLAPGAAVNSGRLLLRLANAGLRMHVPSIVNLPITLIAEDGNPLPGQPRVQNEVFMAAGKTYDVSVQPGVTLVQGVASTYNAATFALFDRQLSLSTNNQRDGGMQGYLALAGGAATGVGTAGAGGSATSVTASNKTFLCVAGTPLSVNDPGAGLLAGATGANGVVLGANHLPAGSNLVLNSNGTFSYTPPPPATAGATAPPCGGSFTFVVNNNVANTFTATINECDASQQDALNSTTACSLGQKPRLSPDSYKSSNARLLTVSPPGVLLNDVDPKGLPLTVDTTTVAQTGGPGTLTLVANPDGSFSAVAPVAGIYTFEYNVRNSQLTAADSKATVTLNFPAGSGLQVNLVDQKVPGRTITDYRWIIEEDRTFWIDPKCQVNSAARPNDSYGRQCPPTPVEALGYNFHSAAMPVVATGCVGTVSCEQGQTVLGSPAVCDEGDGTCRTTDATGAALTALNAVRAQLTPDQVALDPNKHYFISVMPGDGINPTVQGYAGDPSVDCLTDGDFTPGTGRCGHNMGGAQIAPQFDPTGARITPAVTIHLAQTPLPTAKIAVLVYEDDYPLNGENDAGGGVDIVAPNEAGLGGFQIELLDQAGGLGDSTGQITYDMFNMPVSNSLAGTPDPMHSNQDACPITSNPDNIVGMIVTCPTYEADGTTISPLAGQAVIKNLYPGIYEIQAFPAADRVARGEEWLQTNTLDGGKPHEAFIRPGEPAYFQEFGPGGFHVQIGFANPKIINDRRHNAAGTGLCDPTASGGGGLLCNSTITGHVHGNHMSRTPDERTYDTGSYDAFAFSQCYVSLGIPDEQDFAFEKCDSNGDFTMKNMPDGVYKLAVFDQWNDIMLDGLITSATVNGNTDVTVTATQWRTNLYTRTYIDTDGNGIPTRDASGNDTEPGAPLIPILIRYRDGSIGFANQTDLNGYATYNEVFPFMNWLVVEPDQTRYKPTGEHVVYDAGGADDCSQDELNVVAAGGRGNCSNTAANLAGTVEFNSLPLALRIPGAVYCTDADCTGANSPGDESIKLGAYYSATHTDISANAANIAGLSSGRIDPPWRSEAWQGLLGQHSFIDFGMKPYVPGETGGIQGLVVYASTRPYDDPTLLTQLQWEPAVPNVQVNLYQETVAADGTKTLTLVDSTLTSSWDRWAQGFRTGADGQTLVQVSDGANAANNGYVPNMNCPGQDPTSGFFATLQGSKEWLDQTVDANGNLVLNAPKHALAYGSQFKCYDGWSQLNQIQPAPYDGKYMFPSVVALDPVSGRPTGTGMLNGVANTTGPSGTNCTICTPNPDDGTPMLPVGKYVVEVVTPPGFEIVKEEDKNILMGDIYIAPVTQQFAGLGDVYILPDQASIAAHYNANNPLNPTTNLGVSNPREDFASTNQIWPCVGQTRIVPDTMSLFPTVGQTAPFAGASRPLCDRKEVTLVDQQAVSARFFVFTKNHIAGHFVGGMTNDMASEFDPFSPQFGEKFGVPNLPIRMRDFVGDEVTRVYGDQWGAYNGMYFSSWEVNPPNPTGYAPQMSVACMNDPGPILDTDPRSPTHGQMITDPAYNPAYSNFCYETPFMPGFTAYMDTPVTPVQAFADHYNLPDAEYPDQTPVIRRVDSSDGIGPWVNLSGGQVTGVTVTAPGSKYTSRPNVSIKGAGGNGATASVNDLQVVALAVGSGGSGYTSAPAVTFSGGGGLGASATAVLTNGIVTGFTNLAGGSGYTGVPTVTIAPFATLTEAAGTVSTGKVVTLSNNGNGYCSAPQVSFSGGAGGDQGRNARWSGTAHLTGGRVTSVTITGSRAYTTAPTMTIAAPAAGACNSATATASMGVNTIAITATGAGYTAATVGFTAGGGGSGAKATATVANSTQVLTIQALGDRVVQNPQFAGPSAISSPYNQKTITRHYGFGTQCQKVNGVLSGTFTENGVSSACAVESTVTIGGFPATVTSWNDSQIVVKVPAGLAGCTQASCVVRQLHQLPAKKGQLVITAGNGKQSIDGITVTVGGKAPTIVEPSCTPASRCSTAFGEFYPNPLQTAIDKAAPGDLLIVDAGSYRENLLMWKPVRLQGVGAASSTVNADAQPAGKMDAWRLRVDCLFGLTTQGVPNPGNSKFDQQFSCPADMYFRSDRIPFEGFVGWDASSNGNLAQVLQEPSLMGAYEGAGITVLGRGVNQSGSGNSDLWGQGGGAGTFPAGSRYVSADDCTPNRAPASNVDDYSTSNFLCNASGIDGLSILNSSQGGGGIFLHGWNHSVQIANNRISANAGTLSGAINLGNGETPPAFAVDNVTCGNTGANPAPLCPPNVPNAQLPNVPAPQFGGVIPFQLNTNVHIHHNQILDNASIGDALFSGSPAGAGGVTISAGSDNYELDHNWIAANLTSSDGGGIAQMGLSFNGRIHNNYVLFNQANNPTLPVDGGGIVIMGAQEDRTLPNGQECGGTTDLDCPPGIGDGTGPGLVIDSNLILGNSAEDGSGGGLRLRQNNGTEVAAFPKTPANWYDITVTNNIIANNVAGWDGGGVSLQDSFRTTFTNNTVSSNDTTASAGVLFKTLGAISAASPPPGCIPTPDPTKAQDPNCLLTNGPHIPQPAGLVTMQNTPNMMAQFTGDVTCPAGFGYGTIGNNGTETGLTNGRCLLVSLPQINNDLFWQNRAFHVEIVDAKGNTVTGTNTPTGTGLYSHQNIVALMPTLTYGTVIGQQQYTGQCGVPPAGQELYWDLGVRMDLGFANIPQGLALGNHALVFNQATVGTTYGVTPGKIPAADVGPVALTARNSILTDSTNSANVNSMTTAPNVVPGAGTTPVIGQYCNGARIPPEQCSSGQGANNPGMCKGYFTPAGQSENVGVAPVFVFNGIAASATVDEGNNWINMTYGPLTLARPPVVAGSTPSAEPTVAVAAVGTVSGAYSIDGSSAAVGAGNASAPGTPATDFYGQPRSKGGVSIGAVEYTPSAPTLTGISPNSGQATTTVPVTLTGTNFTAGSTIAVSGNGITVNAVVRGSATQLTANFVISGNAALGARNVTVTSAGGTSGAVTFTVTAPPPPPTLTSISPTGGARGAAALQSNAVAVTLTGTNLAGATSITVSGGITVTNLTVVNATTVTATFNILGLVNAGAHNVTITTPSGTSGAVTFTVTAPAAITLTQISPASGTHGTAVQVTLTGTGFVSGTTNVVVTCTFQRCGLNGPRVTVSNVNVTSGTTLTATLTIAGNAALGARTVTVANGLLNTASQTFTVN